MKGSARTLQSKKDFIAAYKNSLGDVSAACRNTRIGRRTYYVWSKDDPLFRELIEDALQDIKDWGESALKLAMQGIPIRDPDTKKITGYTIRPDIAAIIFFNKTQNKDRGYIERLETQEVHGVQIVVRDEKDGEIVERVAKTLRN